MFARLDDWIHYNDPSLPQFSSLTYLFFTVLLSASFIALDLGNFRERKEPRIAEMPEFKSVSAWIATCEVQALTGPRLR